MRVSKLDQYCDFVGRDESVRGLNRGNGVAVGPVDLQVLWRHMPLYLRRSYSL